MTQADLTNAINRVVNDFTGQRIAFPNGQYMGECTVPIVWLLTYLGQPSPPMHNNRADGWGVINPPELLPYWDFQAFDPNASYPRGTIMMWDSPHIAIVLSDSGGDNVVTVFEQNADPDGAACKTTNRILNNAYHHATVAMIPKLVEPAPVPTPASYIITETYNPAKLVKLNKQPTNLWGMNYHFDYMKDHPIEVHNQGEIQAITNKVHHEDGYDYYRREGQVDGFNVLDCDDYTPPEPKPYTPPAAPVTVPKATKYTLVTDVSYFTTPNNAKNHYKEAGKLKAGEYFQISSDSNMLNLSSDNMKDLQHWVNPTDNVALPEPEPTPPPVPAPVPEPAPDKVQLWFNKIYWMNSSRLPVTYIATKDVDVKDYSGTRPETFIIPQGATAKVYGTIRDGAATKFYLLKLPTTSENPTAMTDPEFQYRFAVPMVGEDGRATLLKQAVKEVRNRDHITVIASELEEMGLKFIDNIIPKWYRKNNNKRS